LPFEYEAGSVETLLRLVELQQGITVLPELATVFMPENQRKMVRRFTEPIPMREVSLVVSRDFVKQRLLQALKGTLIESLPIKIQENRSEKIVPI
jgi:LysR family hydrogen peroxide-inducible transcriptional activator